LDFDFKCLKHSAFVKAICIRIYGDFENWHSLTIIVRALILTNLFSKYLNRFGQQKLIILEVTMMIIQD
jgi:hypothetical protein